MDFKDLGMKTCRAYNLLFLQVSDKTYKRKQIKQH